MVKYFSNEALIFLLKKIYSVTWDFYGNTDVLFFN